MPHFIRIILMVLFILIVLLIIAVTAASVLHNRNSEHEASKVLSSARIDQKEFIQESDLEGLPDCVKKWMRRSGVIGQKRIHTVRLTQSGRMRSAEDKPWMPIKAVQYINVDQPGFVWNAKARMAPFMNMAVRDMYYQGHGHMLVKLLGLVKVVDTKPGMEMDQSTMLRFMAEMIWYPSAALNNYIAWEEINADSARATMTWQGSKASMVFTFDGNGDLIRNVASRYQEVDGKFVLNDWGGVTRGYKTFNGIRIINKADVVWKYKTGDFNWLQIEVTDVEFNQKQIN